MDEKKQLRKVQKGRRSGVEKKSEDGWVSQEKEVEQGQDWEQEQGWEKNEGFEKMC